MQEYICNVCGYIYKPADGDPDADVELGTPFDHLPSDWVCPVCSAEKSQFDPLEI